MSKYWLSMALLLKDPKFWHQIEDCQELTKKLRLLVVKEKKSATDDPMQREALRVVAK